MTIAKLSLIAGAVFGFLSVAIGAFAAHGLKHRLDDYAKGIWNTAVQYQMFHALALIAVAILVSKNPQLLRLHWTVYLWIVGILLFSGSLYVLALSGVKWLGMITPLGGLAFLAGWLLLILFGYDQFK